MDFKEYKVIQICESGCSTLLLGSAQIPEKIMEEEFNKHAKQGWQVVFQVVERRRFLFFWSRESVIVTLGRR